MKCNKCGEVLDPDLSVCGNCSNPAGKREHATPVQSKLPGPARRSRFKLALLTIGVVGLIGAAVGFFLFAGLNGALNSSEANRTAIKFLKQSPRAADALGEIKDVGWPYGELQPDFATLYMSVKGTKGTGNYFASLKKENGEWILVSGRVELSNGTSVEIKEASAVPSTAASLQTK